MGEYVNPSNREFWIARKSEIFVDKSMLISYINRCMDTVNRFICVTRPRRFGKSTDARMLAAYYSRGCDSSALFEDLKIASSGPDPYRNRCHFRDWKGIWRISCSLESAIIRKRKNMSAI